METDALVETLEDAGLSPYQANAYVALLELGTASATEIADASDVPGPRVYDVLDALAEREYVETYEEGTLRARAHSPAEVLEDLRDRADRLESAADEIEERWEQPTLESTEASIVKRFRTVVDRARLFVEEAEYRIHLSVTAAQLDRLRPALADAHDRGVAVHVLLHTDVDGEAPAPETVAGCCTEARHRALPTPFIALIDRRNACFAPHPDAADRYGVLVNDRDHTFVFHWYFMTCLWEHATPIHTARGDTPPFEYVDLRRLVREAAPLFDAGATVTVRVDGTDLTTGDPRTVVGPVVEARSVGAPTDDDPDPTVAGQVTLLVDTDDGPVSVGGWNAVVEDVEATRIVVERIDWPDGSTPLAPEEWRS
jgi:sugar-specific transcriptional regulator TrmB